MQGKGRDLKKLEVEWPLVGVTTSHAAAEQCVCVQSPPLGVTTSHAATKRRVCVE
jgi:hypothetical protein